MNYVLYTVFRNQSRPTGQMEIHNGFYITLWGIINFTIH
jgi:hypothetical protein